MNVADLKPYAKKIELTVLAVNRHDTREVPSKLDQRTHTIAEILVGDETGCVLLTLWDDAIQSIVPGKTYTIANAYTSLFKNSLRLNLGRYGTVQELGEKKNVNMKNNVSERELSGNKFGEP